MNMSNSDVTDNNNANSTSNNNNQQLKKKNSFNRFKSKDQWSKKQGKTNTANCDQDKMESLKTSDSLNQTTTQNSEPVKNNFNEHNANSNDIFKNKKVIGELPSGWPKGSTSTNLTKRFDAIPDQSYFRNKSCIQPNADLIFPMSGIAYMDPLGLINPASMGPLSRNTDQI